MWQNARSADHPRLHACKRESIVVHVKMHSDSENPFSGERVRGWAIFSSFLDAIPLCACNIIATRPLLPRAIVRARRRDGWTSLLSVYFPAAARCPRSRSNPINGPISFSARPKTHVVHCKYSILPGGMSEKGCLVDLLLAPAPFKIVEKNAPRRKLQIKYLLRNRHQWPAPATQLGRNI